MSHNLTGHMGPGGLSGHMRRGRRRGHNAFGAIVLALLLLIIPFSSTSAHPPANFTAAISVTRKVERTVYITRTGEKYHLDGCRYLSRSKIAIKLKDAIRQGYTACKVCRP